ncbi:MAG: TetR/AcrR family transcriptional regulator [Pseudomonadota bacterium]
MTATRWGKNTREDNASSACALILNAAKTCFERNGLSITTMSHIAEEARVSRRTIYRYFQKKEDIIQNIVDEQSIAFLNIMDQELKNNHDTFIELIREYVVYMITYGPHTPEYELLLGSKNINKTQEYYYSSSVIADYWNELTKEPFKTAQQRGEIHSDIKHNELSRWVVRIILSYIAMPIDKTHLHSDIDHFFIRSIATS